MQNQTVKGEDGKYITTVPDMEELDDLEANVDADRLIHMTREETHSAVDVACNAMIRPRLSSTL
jgi:hypothetical protein